MRVVHGWHAGGAHLLGTLFALQEPCQQWAGAVGIPHGHGHRHTPRGHGVLMGPSGTELETKGSREEFEKLNENKGRRPVIGSLAGYKAAGRLTAAAGGHI